MRSESLMRGADKTTGAMQSLTHALKRREALAIPLSIALVSRGMVFVVADFILRWALADRLGPARYTGALRVWLQKDAVWYLAIAQRGYEYSPVAQSRANFFPLYPLLIHIFAPMFAIFPVSNPAALAGMAIAWLAFAGACVALYQLALGRFGRRVARCSVMLLALFPFSFYYGAVYTESIYLLLAAWAFVAIERRQWWLAGTLAGLASAARPPGLLIGACVALAYALDWLRMRHPLRPDFLALGLTPLGTAAYMLYCWARWGDPLAYIKTSRAGWHGGQMQLGGLRFIAHVLAHPIRWLTPPDLTSAITLLWIILALVFLAALPWVWRVFGPVYTFFALVSILVPILDFPTTNSLGRYLSVVFPVFMVVAYLLRGHPRVAGWLAVVSGMLLIVFASCFIAGYGLS
jgi:hypothetical protein